MKTNRTIQMMLAVLMTLILLRPAISEEAPKPLIDTQAQQTEFGSVSYPALSQYPDELTQAQVNLLLLERGKVMQNIDTLAKQDATGFGMNADFEAMLESDILSVVFSMRGDLNNHATEHAYETINFDLVDKREIEITDIFTDVDAAVDHMEAIMIDSFLPMLSGYVVNEEVTPLPIEKFSLTKDAITFYYDDDQLMMLSGYAGSASFFYYEIAPYLDISQDSILARLGVYENLQVQPDAKQNISDMVSHGRLPGFAFKLGDMFSDIFATYRLFSDPDYFPGGQFFQLEDGRMRGVMLLSDEEKRDYTQTPLLGIRFDRINLFGIKVYETTQDEWRALLGMPDDHVVLDAYTAQDFLLPAGESDYYIYGNYRLRLHADEDGLLTCLYIIE